MFVCLCVFVPVLCHSIPSHFGELERPRPRHGTKRRWWDLVAADVQAVGLRVGWYGVAQDGKEWEEVCRQCCAYDINKDIGHCVPNSSNTNVDTFFPCSCGCSFRCPGDLTRHRQICDGAQHHTKATEKWPTHLTASVEELQLERRPYTTFQLLLLQYHLTFFKSISRALCPRIPLSRCVCVFV